MLWTPRIKYEPYPFESEAELEAAIVSLGHNLFGPARYYLDVKRKIGAKGGQRNIPDGYVLDLTSSSEPNLYVVENEVASHDFLRHIAIQVLQFSLSFEQDVMKVKSIVKDTLQDTPLALAAASEYAKRNGYENIDFLLEKIVRSSDAFKPLVIIDDLLDDLETVLMDRFRFPVEILTLQRYRSESGEVAYEFEPFLQEMDETVFDSRPGKAAVKEVDPTELDTVVVPARKEGFEKVFLGENRWYKIRMHGAMIPRIKYIAAYQVDPVSAITHFAEVKSIQPWPGSNKYVLNFEGTPRRINDLALVKNGKVRQLQGPRYTSFKKLMSASTLDDAF